MTNQANQWDRSRLMVASSYPSSIRLNALPVASFGNLLGQDKLRTAAAHRIRAQKTEQVKCKCGARVDECGLHPLSCRLQGGRFPRHSHINDIIKRALTKAGVPSLHKLTGLDCEDGRRPDGVTVFSWRLGKSLLWDATVVDTFSKSNVCFSAIDAGSAASRAETMKSSKYASLFDRYLFQPIAFKTTGACGESTLQFLRDLGRRLRDVTGESRELQWLLQRRSLGICRGNAYSVIDCISHFKPQS